MCSQVKETTKRFPLEILHFSFVGHFDIVNKRAVRHELQFMTDGIWERRSQVFLQSSGNDVFGQYSFDIVNYAFKVSKIQGEEISMSHRQNNCVKRSQLNATQ